MKYVIEEFHNNLSAHYSFFLASHAPVAKYVITKGVLNTEK
jgi:hypothetical protein